jgi:hypothetical protein
MRKALKRGVVAALVVAGLVTALVTTATPGFASVPQSVAAKRLHEFQGKIISINRHGHKFRLRDRDRGKVRIKANRKTRYKRPLHRFRDLFEGQRVEVKADRKHGRWIAVKIESRGPPVSPP